MKKLLYAGISLFLIVPVNAQQHDPKETEWYQPEPLKVTPGKSQGQAPSDAIILFDGKDMSMWETEKKEPVQWKIKDGALTVVPGTGQTI